MFIFKGINALVDTLKDDSFNVLISTYNYMTPKLKDNDYVEYHNTNLTNEQFWGEGYSLLKQIVNLPKRERDNVKIVFFRENNNVCSVFYVYKKKYYQFYLNRKYKQLHKIMDRINEIFEVEDSEGLNKKWKYLMYQMS